jgi:hypothetical protein
VTQVYLTSVNDPPELIGDTTLTISEDEITNIFQDYYITDEDVNERMGNRVLFEVNITVEYGTVRFNTLNKTSNSLRVALTPSNMFRFAGKTRVTLFAAAIDSRWVAHPHILGIITS